MARRRLHLQGLHAHQDPIRCSGTDIESPKYTEAKRLDDVMEEYYYESLVGQGAAGTSSGTAPVPTVEEADSPDKPYSPSEATAEEQDFFGRKMLRKMHGQNPADYTHSPNLHHPGLTTAATSTRSRARPRSSPSSTRRNTAR